MRDDERRELERRAYGRNSSEADRDRARELLAQPDTASPPPFRRAFLVAILGTAVLVLAGATTWWALQPRNDSTPSSLPTPTSSPSMVIDIPVLVPDPEVTISPNIRVPSIELILGPDNIVQTIELGEYEDNGFWGTITADGQACISSMFSDIQQGQHKCLSLAEWAETGLNVDRGAWGITWYSDGSVVWDGTS